LGTPFSPILQIYVVAVDFCETNPYVKSWIQIQ
jgi:hypothetical protein